MNSSRIRLICRGRKWREPEPHAAAKKKTLPGQGLFITRIDLAMTKKEIGFLADAPDPTGDVDQG